MQIAQAFNRVVSGGLGFLFARGLAILVQFVSVPITSAYLDSKSFAIWIFITTLVSICTLFDIGLGSSIVNISARTSEREGFARVISQSLTNLCLTFFPAFFFALLGIGFIYGSFSTDMGMDVFKEKNLMLSASVYLLIAIAHTPLVSALQSAMGCGKPVYVYCAQGVGSTLFLLSVVWAAESKLSIIALVGVSYGSITLIHLICYLLFVFKYKSNSLGFDWQMARELFRNAKYFWILQLGVMIQVSVGALIVAEFLELEKVPQYTLSQKLFSVTGVVLSAFLNMLWPTLAAMRDTNKIEELRVFLGMASTLCLTFSIGSAILLYFSVPYLLPLLTEGKVQANSTLSLHFALFSALNGLGGILATIMNGFDMVRVQALLGSIAAMICLILSMFLVQSIGVAGPILASLLTLFPLYVVYIVLLTPHFFKY